MEGSICTSELCHTLKHASQLAQRPLPYFLAYMPHVLLGNTLTWSISIAVSHLAWYAHTLLEQCHVLMHSYCRTSAAAGGGSQPGNAAASP